MSAMERRVRGCSRGPSRGRREPPPIVLRRVADAWAHRAQLSHVILASCVLLGACSTAIAAPSDGTMPPAAVTYAASEPFRDPGTPPALRRSALPAARSDALAAVRSAPRASGAALEVQVREKLRASFDAADVRHRGALTAAEARDGGFGYIASRFDAIDARHAGEVTFDDLMNYLAHRRTPGAN